MRSTHDMEYEQTEPVSLAVVDAVSAVTGIPPTLLPPLADCIETDALDAMFRAPIGVMTRRSLTFCYAECMVTVAGDGTLTITYVD